MRRLSNNTREILCKTCGVKFNIYPSRVGTRKYCSKLCAQKDNYGFKPRVKKCIECGEEFLIKEGLRCGEKLCSLKCRKDAMCRRSKEQRERKKVLEVERKCRQCGKTVISSAYCPQNFCNGKYGECFRLFNQQTRMGKANPAYRNGLAVVGKRTYTGKHLRACKKYRGEFLLKNDYLFCEVCGINANATPRFEVHHIYYASLFPKHKELHNPKNLILLCIQCHNDMHSGKMRSEVFNKLEKERGLKELFTTQTCTD